MYSPGNVAPSALQTSGLQFSVGPVGPNNSLDLGASVNKSIGRFDWHAGISPGRDPGVSFGVNFKL